MRKIYTLVVIVILTISLGTISSCKKGESNITPAAIDSLNVGLIAYYPFNNTGVDFTGNGNDGVVYNITGTSDRNGKANAAYHFDGSTSYIQVKDNQALRLNGTDYTINTWVKLDQYNSTNGSFIVNKRTSGPADGWGFSITNYSSPNNILTKGLMFFGPGGTDPYALGTKVLALNQWYMITTIYNYSKQQVSFYVNGVLDNVTTGIASPNAAITGDMFIGSDNLLTTTNYNLKGSLDDMRIYKRALTIAELQKLYVLTF
jgi:hypothetical protein